MICGIDEAIDYVHDDCSASECWGQNGMIAITRFNWMVYELFQRMNESFNKDSNLGPILLQRFFADYGITSEEFDYTLEGLGIIRDMYDTEKETRQHLEEQKAQREHDRRMGHARAKMPRARRR